MVTCKKSNLLVKDVVTFTLGKESQFIHENQRSREEPCFIMDVYDNILKLVSGINRKREKKGEQSQAAPGEGRNVNKLALHEREVWKDPQSVLGGSSELFWGNYIK